MGMSFHGATRIRQSTTRKRRPLSLLEDRATGSSAVAPEGDALVLWLILVVGAIRPIQAFLRHESWGVEATVGLLMAIFAARVLASDLLLGWANRRVRR
jgi:ABC-type transporter Mla maintaining outer membrane lipid asymmetry permease subunit MlaE